MFPEMIRSFGKCDSVRLASLVFARPTFTYEDDRVCKVFCVWSTDVIDKQEEYLALGVPEYWIIDYRGLIPAKYCLRGKGKKAIVLILENGEYQRSEYLEGETISCLTFPDLTLTVDQVLAADAEDVV